MKKSYILLLFIILLKKTSIISSPKYNLSACAIFQNEAKYLKEWIEFHKLVGFEHFYLYNHFSIDNYLEILEPYIKNKEVELIQWTVPAKQDDLTWQLSAYNHALNKTRNVTEWLAIFDIDEFLFPTQCINLIDFLKEYKKFASLQVNWVMYGTSNIKKIPTGQPIIEYLTLRAPQNHNENLHTKMIIQPKFVTKILSSHCPELSKGYLQVNSNKVAFKGPFSPYVLIDKIRINHYWTRDEDFFYNVKIPRRLATRGEEQIKAIIDRNNDINKEQDYVILKFLNKLKKRMSF